MFVGLVLMLDFVRIVEASVSSTLCMRDRRQRRNIMVLSGLYVGIFSSLDWKWCSGVRIWTCPEEPSFSRRITLAIPEKHAWARTVGNEKLLT